MKLNFTLNQKPIEVEITPMALLIDVIRELGLTGVKLGCGEGSCGACVLLVDEKPINSCVTLAAKVQGKEVLSIEGLGSIDNPHPIQKAFVDEAGVQCGFCTPGIILIVYSILKVNPNPTDEEIAQALDGNYCRCTGYVKIFESVRKAAKLMAKGVAK